MPLCYRFRNIILLVYMNKKRRYQVYLWVLCMSYEVPILHHAIIDFFYFYFFLIHIITRLLWEMDSLGLTSKCSQMLGLSIFELHYLFFFFFLLWGIYTKGRTNLKAVKWIQTIVPSSKSQNQLLGTDTLLYWVTSYPIKEICFLFKELTRQ